MRSRVGFLIAGVAIAAASLTAPSPVAAASASVTQDPWSYVDAERDCKNVLQAKVTGADGELIGSRVIARSGEGRSLAPLAVQGNRVLFEDYDCRTGKTSRIRLATLGKSAVKLKTLTTVSLEGWVEPRVSATFNETGSRIVVGTGSDLGWPADIALQTFRTSTREIVRTTTLRGAGSMGRLSSGPDGVIHLQTTREVPSQDNNHFDFVVVPIRGKQIGTPLFTIHSDWENVGYYRSAVSRQGSVAVAQYDARRIQIVPKGKGRPRATSAPNGCGEEGIDNLAWLDSQHLLVDCGGSNSYVRFLIDLTGAKATKRPVYDHVKGGPYRWVVGPG